VLVCGVLLALPAAQVGLVVAVFVVGAIDAKGGHDVLRISSIYFMIP
jgi:hypothetical protein